MTWITFEGSLTLHLEEQTIWSLDGRRTGFMRVGHLLLHKALLSKGPTLSLVLCFCCLEILDNFIFDCFVIEVWWDNVPGMWAEDAPKHNMHVCCSLTPYSHVAFVRPHEWKEKPQEQGKKLYILVHFFENICFTWRAL